MSRNLESFPNRFCVAVIDDDEDQRGLVRRALEIRGYLVLEFDSSEAALGWGSASLIDENPPIADSDMILLDIGLPGLSGIETLHLLKENPKLKHIPVAMITGHSTAESVLKCIRAGASDYFVKPLDFPEVMRRIDKIIADRTNLISKTAVVDLKWGFQEFLVRELKISERNEDNLSILIGGIRRSPLPLESITGDDVDFLWTDLPSEGSPERHAVENLVSLCRANMREYDVLVVFGTGEFAGIFPSTDAEGLDTVIKKIHRLFESSLELPQIPRNEHWILLTGGACYPQDGKDRLMLFTVAEARLSHQPPVQAPMHDADDPVSLKRQRCISCDKHFSYPKAQIKRLKPLLKESDQRIIYENVEALLYNIIACPHCGLAAHENDLPALRHMDASIFGWSYSPCSPEKKPVHSFKAVLPPELEAYLYPPFEAWRNRDAASIDIRNISKLIQDRDNLLRHIKSADDINLATVEKSLARHLLARETYRIAAASPLRRARIAHRIAWLYRIQANKSLEKRFLREALDFYQTAFCFEDLTGGRAEMEIFFLIGELSLRLGKVADASALFESLLHDPRLAANDPLLETAHQRLETAQTGGAIQ